jgi:hypothetical protein
VRGEPTVKVDVHDANGRRFPTFSMTLQVTRRPEYYLTNVALPIAVFSGLAFTAFSIPPAEVADRLGVALTLLLSLAAYKFAVTSMIPQVSYQTLLDRYVLDNFLLLAAVALTVGLLPRFLGVSIHSLLPRFLGDGDGDGDGGGGGGGGGGGDGDGDGGGDGGGNGGGNGGSEGEGDGDGSGGGGGGEGGGGGGDIMDGACFVALFCVWCGIQLWHHCLPPIALDFH